MKNTLFSFILLLLIYLVVETLSFTAYLVKFHSYSLYDIQHSKLDAIEKLTASKVFQPAEAIQKNVEIRPILHPYIGYSIDGKRRTENCESETIYDCYTRIRTYSDAPLATRGKDKLVVAIVGGSFADGTARGGTPGINEKLLAEIPKFSNRGIVLYNLAGGGYKQPQQLMHINYFYALGAEFDIIINIDGFNEIGASFYGWRDSQLHPAFPVSWNNRVLSGMDEEKLDLLADKRALQKAHAARAKIWLSEVMRYSPTMNFVWALLNAQHQSKLATANDALAVISKQNKPRDFDYEALGPDFHLPEWEDFNDYAIDLWANSSRALSALARGHGAQYFHFIQPNHYIPASKPLSVIEHSFITSQRGGYGMAYQKALPKLVIKAAELAASGEPVIDLSNMFQGNPETLYIDNCCHLNPKGYDLVAREIVRHIALKNSD